MDFKSDLVGTPTTPARDFQTTIWSEVLHAGRGDDTRAHVAMSRLCQAYWYPIYSYVRRRGYPLHEAQDLTQGFFTRLLQTSQLEGVKDARGRFRSFLITSLKWYLANEWDKAQAAKRGGSAVVFSLDEESAEERFQAEAPTDSPERAFDRQWAGTILERVLSRMRKETAEKETSRFERLCDHAFGRSKESYADTAAAFGLSEGAIKSAVRRVRLRCGELFREEIAETVAVTEEIDDEVRYLISLIGE